MRFTPSPNREAGVSLIECLVYIAILLVMLGIAFTAFTQLHRQSSYLRRNTEDIARALKAGEQWRAEIRRAAAVDIVEGEGVPIIRLKDGGREILFAHQEEQVWRRELPDGYWKPFLKGVRNSEMRAERGEHVTAWVWEVELVAGQKTVRLPPLFSFMAVPRNSQNNETGLLEK